MQFALSAKTRFALRAEQFVQERLHRSEIHPDAWPARLIRDPAETEAKLAAVAGDRYSYHELDDFTDLIAPHGARAPEVAKIDRKGVLAGTDLPRLLAGAPGFEYGVKPADLKDILGARNITLPGGHSRSARKTSRSIHRADLRMRNKSAT